MEKISNLFISVFQGKPLTALCWGHNDRRLFVAAGFNLHVAWVMKKVPHLQFLCQRIIQICIKSEKLIRKLPLPARLHHSVQTMFSPTIKVNQVLKVLTAQILIMLIYCIFYIQFVLQIDWKCCSLIIGSYDIGTD